MHFALVPGLLLALALGGSHSHPDYHADPRLLNSFFSFTSQSPAQAATAGTTPTVRTVLTTTRAVTGTTPTVSAVLTTTGATGSATVALTPLPTATPAPSMQLNPFDLNFLLSPAAAPNVLGPFAWACLAFIIALFAASAYFYFYRRKSWKRSNPPLFRAVARWSQAGLWLAGLGLLLLLVRVVQLDFFNLRVWLYLWLLLAIGSAAYFFYWYRTAYPKEVDKYARTQRAKQYIPSSAAKASARATGPKTSTPIAQPATRTQAKGNAKQTASKATPRKRK